MLASIDALRIAERSVTAPDGIDIYYEVTSALAFDAVFLAAHRRSISQARAPIHYYVESPRRRRRADGHDRCHHAKMIIFDDYATP